MLRWLRRKPEETPAVPAAVHGALQMDKPWARACSFPLPNNLGGAFLSIANKGEENDRLVTASSPMIDRIELHGIKVVGADIVMRPMTNGLAIQAGGTTTLKPRGYHLLLVGMTAPLTYGATLPVTLFFEKAGNAAVEFAVTEPGLVGEAILYEEHHRG